MHGIANECRWSSIRQNSLGRGGQHHGAAVAVLGALVVLAVVWHSFRSGMRQCRLGTRFLVLEVFVGSRGAAASLRSHQGRHPATKTELFQVLNEEIIY